MRSIGKTRKGLRQEIKALRERLVALEQAERALRGSEARYRAILEESADAIVSLDPWLNITAWSTGAERILGYVKEEVIGKPLSILVPEHKRESTAEILRIVRERGFVRDWETHRLAKDGHLVDVEMTVTDLGPELGFTAILRDITERKQAERQLQKYRAQLEQLHRIALDITGQLELSALLETLVRDVTQLLDAEAGGIYLYRPERDVLEWAISVNAPVPAGSELKRGEGLSGRVWERGEPIIVDDYDEWNGAQPDIRKRSLGGSVVAAPITWGETFLGVIDAASAQANTFSEQDAHLLSLFADQAAIAIKNARLFTELEASNRELDSFSQTVAHDLKGPLTSIIGFGSLLEEEIHGYSEEVDYLLDVILKAALKMADMIDQLLLLAVLRDTSAIIEPVDAADAIKMVLLGLERQIAEREVTIEVMPNLPVALGHRQWVSAVFANLVNNAIKYIGKENPDPRIAIRGSRQGDYVRYEVEDNGLGITPEDQKKLFDIFTRFHHKESSGMGLGLSIVHRVVTNLNGEVGVESTPGQGSTFWFTLPAADVEE